MENPELFRTVKAKIDLSDQSSTKKGEGPCLIIISGPDLGKVFFINKPVMVIGREPERDIFLNESHISRRHAQLISRGEDVQLVDLGSTNGSFVNGEQIKEKTLIEGDEVRIGNVIMKFLSKETVTSGSSDGGGRPNETVRLPSSFYQRIYNECEAFLGDRTSKFLDRQIEAHLSKAPETLDFSDKIELVKWIKLSASLILDDERAEELVQRILAIEE